MEADRETMVPGIVEGLEPFKNESGWWMEVVSPKRGWFFCGSLISSRERVMANLARMEVK